MNALLERLVREAALETAERRANTSEAELERRLDQAAPPFDFRGALRQPHLAVIAEVKAKTPLAGQLVNEYDPATLASAYQEGGAAAVSVLCQRASFGGSPDDLGTVKSAARLPTLRKDFVTDEYQVVEARVLGADAVLLIVAALAEPRLRSLVECARSIGLEPLVEVHSPREVQVALSVGATTVGINHRDLDTFDVDVSLTERLRAQIPDSVVVVAESGIRSRDDALRLRRAGANAILVGETLMRAEDPAAKVRELSVT